jgi:hypothetical protein
LSLWLIEPCLFERNRLPKHRQNWNYSGVQFLLHSPVKTAPYMVEVHMIEQHDVVDSI